MPAAAWSWSRRRFCTGCAPPWSRRRASSSSSLLDAEAPDALTLAQLEQLDLPGFDFDLQWRAVSADDVLTLIYTSGTTGPPKGVELTHRGLLASVERVDELIEPSGRTDA